MHVPDTRSGAQMSGRRMFVSPTENHRHNTENSRSVPVQKAIENGTLCRKDSIRTRFETWWVWRNIGFVGERRVVLISRRITVVVPDIPVWNLLCWHVELAYNGTRHISRRQKFARENNSPVFDEMQNERLTERSDDGGNVSVMTSCL